MSPIFKTKEDKRRNELKDLLDSDVVYDKSYFKRLWEYLKKNYKIILIVLLVIYTILRNIFYYNTLIIMRQNVTNAQAQIESALQMRQNIIPALTVVVYQFIKHEKNVFLQTVEARGDKGISSKDYENLKSTIKNLITSDVSGKALSSFMAVAENYPQLVSNQSYQLLITQISDTEKQIYEKRTEYNDFANIYNTKLRTFPTNVFGRMLGFRVSPYFNWEQKSEWILSSKTMENEAASEMQMELKKE